MDMLLYLSPDLYVPYLLHFTLKSTTYALALKPKPLVVRSTDRGRDPGSLKNGIDRRYYGIVFRDTLALKLKPLVVLSRDCGRYQGLLKNWHCSPRLWHRSPRRACSKTKTIGSAE